MGSFCEGQERVRLGDGTEQTLRATGGQDRKPFVVMTRKALKHRGEKIVRPRPGNFSRIMSRAMITPARSGFAKYRLMS